MLVMQSGSAVPVVSYGYTALVLEYNIAGLQFFLLLIIFLGDVTVVFLLSIEVFL